VYNSAVFAGIDLFALKVYLDRVVSINHSWHQKTRDTGLSDSEDRIRLRSLVLTQYHSVTDGRTHEFAIAYTALVNELAVKTPKMALSSDTGIQFSTKYTCFYNSVLNAGNVGEC